MNPSTLANDILRSILITATGFSNWVQGSAGTCKIVCVQARGAVAGDSPAVTANAGPVYVLIKKSVPVSGDKAVAMQLVAGASMDFYVNDTSEIFICGASGDSVRVLSVR